MLYDVIIVGGGPGGLTSAIYSLRAGKKVVLIEKMVPGGQVALTSVIENYPGYKSVEGSDLAYKMFEQATELGLETVFADVTEYDLKNETKKIITTDGTFEGKTVILSMGASAKKLNVEKEDFFTGKGVSYCATCDGNFFKGKDVAVVGGGNTSLEDAMYLSNLANKVYLIHRRDEFRGDFILSNQIRALASKENSNIELVLNSQVTKLLGDDKISGIIVHNKVSNEDTQINLDGVFVAIGRQPETKLLKDIIDLDDNGYIITDEKMQTNVKGVFSAGDVRQKQLRQIVTACSDGAIASLNTNEYILNHFGS